MLKKNPKVDEYFSKPSDWNKEMNLLRSVVLESGLTEELKWKSPCYCLINSNVLMIAPFKTYVALSFFKGVLLKDSNGLLVSPGKNSQSVRLLKFTTVKQIIKLKKLISEYINEAKKNEEKGLKVELKKSSEFQILKEFQQRLDDNKSLAQAFFNLTPGRQRGYLLYFEGAKQTSTKIARIEKFIPRILGGVGIHDCTCGLSKRLPSCDGSHKLL